jgi:hypothetical protein
MNCAGETPDAVPKREFGDAQSKQETPTVDSLSSIYPSGVNETTASSREEFQPVGRNAARPLDSPSLRSSKRGTGKNKPDEGPSAPLETEAGAMAESTGDRLMGGSPVRTVDTLNSYPRTKMQMLGGVAASLPSSPAGTNTPTASQRSRSGDREPCASAGPSSELKHPTKYQNEEGTAAFEIAFRPGAFCLVPGLPPVPAGDFREGEETESSHDNLESNPRRRKRAVVMDAMLVEDANQPSPSSMSELQHATEVHPADLPVGVFRRRAMVLVLIVVLIFVASTVSGVLVANNRDADPESIPKITFEEFVNSLLPVRYLENALRDPLSAQGQALEWLKEDTKGLVMDGWRLLQRYSLSVIYYSLNGQSWFNGSGWLTPSDECSWFHTWDNPDSRSCDANGRFSFLMLIKNNLTGSIPDEISLLTDLVTIRMSDNRIVGRIPKSMVSLDALAELDLEVNLLAGELPPEFGSMTNVKTFKVGENHLNGTLPTEIGMMSGLNSLRINHNSFAGSLPKTLGLLGNLSSFYAVFNNFIGSLPSEIGLMPNLTSLDLDNNLLSGSIPTELGRLPRLRDVSLLRNSGIRGRIPSELGLATSLRYLNCERTGLTGTIPSEL